MSYPLFLLGAALAWSGETCDDTLLEPVLSRDIFHDPTRRAARAALALGLAHRKFGFSAPNVTPFGAVIAAPRPETRELFCRDGLKHYARIPGEKIQSSWDEVERQRAVLFRSQPGTDDGSLLVRELDLAARMAGESCRIMLWQQALAAGRNAAAKTIARTGIRELTGLDRDFGAYWPARNRGTTAHCSPFLKWRIEDYRHARLHFPPAAARA